MSFDKISISWWILRRKLVDIEKEAEEVINDKRFSRKMCGVN